MALQRLTESFSIRISEEVKTLNESSQIFGARLIEKTADGETRLIEDSKGNQYKAIATYRVPVSRFTKNANGRVYPRELWEKVIREQSGIWEGGPGLANHPGDDDDGDVTKQFCVWRNLGINESTQLVEADLCLVGPHGKHANDILEAGGKLGFSSSGYGELREDKSTVDSSSYILERVSDWVLNPSQGVFGDKSMKKKESVKEEREFDPSMLLDGKRVCECGKTYSGASNQCEECSKNKVKETAIRENNTMDKAEKVKLSKAEIRSFKEKAGEWFAEALTIADPQDRLNELTDIHSYFEDMDESILPEVRSEISTKISEAREEITLAIKEHTKLSQTFGIKEVEALKEGVKKVSEDTMLFKKDAEEWKTLAEGLQEKLKKMTAILEARPTVDAYKTAINFSKKLKEDLEAKDILLENARASMEKTLKKELLVQKNLQEKIVLLENEKKILSEKNMSLSKKTTSLSLEIKNLKENSIKKAIIAKKSSIEENAINLAPRGKAVTTLQGFNEENEVLNYYKDLLRQDPNVKKYREQILACKTVKEAARVHFNNFTNSDVLPRVNESILETLGNRGVRLNERSRLLENLPDTWS